MNVFNFTGGLGRDIEMRFLANGDAIGNFSVAVTSGYGDKQQTTWVSCSLFGKRAESLEPYLKKGQQVAISGELTNRKYQDKSGADKYSLEVRVNDLTLIGSKSEGQAQSNNEPKAQADSNNSGFDDVDNDIPW